MLAICFETIITHFYCMTHNRVFYLLYIPKGPTCPRLGAGSLARYYPLATLCLQPPAGVEPASPGQAGALPLSYGGREPVVPAWSSPPPTT